jgi:glutamyl-tRNA reductase
MTNYGSALLADLRRRGEEIRRVEVTKRLRGLGPLTPDQEREVDALTAAILGRLFGGAVDQIEEMAQEERAGAFAVARTLLGLG